MDILDVEILRLWKLFDQHKPEYIMVDGFAISLHGFSRSTADVDIWIKDTLNNRRVLRFVLIDQVRAYVQIRACIFRHVGILSALF